MVPGALKASSLLKQGQQSGYQAQRFAAECGVSTFDLESLPWPCTSGRRIAVRNMAFAVLSRVDAMATSTSKRTGFGRAIRWTLLPLLLLGAGCTPFPATPRPIDAAGMQDSPSNQPDQLAVVDVAPDALADTGIVTPVDAAQDTGNDIGTTMPTDVPEDVSVDAGGVPADIPVDAPVDRPMVVDAPSDVPLVETRLLVGTFVSSGGSTGLLTGGFTWHGGANGGLLQGWLH